MSKNLIIAGVILLVVGLAVAIGVTLSSEPVAAASVHRRPLRWHRHGATLRLSSA